MSDFTLLISGFLGQKNMEKILVSKRPTLADRFPFGFDGQVLKMLKEEQDEMRIRIVYLGRLLGGWVPRTDGYVVHNHG